MATQLRKEQLSILEKVYPVGCIYIEDASTDPNTLFGFGTWALFGPGRTPVGIDSGDTDLDTSEEEYGEKTHALIVSEMPSHLHTADPPSTASGNETVGHTHSYTRYSTTQTQGSGTNQTGVWSGTSSANSGNNSATHTHTLDIAEFDSADTGSGTAHNNIQPSVVVYIWKRTA